MCMTMEYTYMYMDKRVIAELTTWFCAQIDTTPLDIDAMTGRTGCH